MELIDLTQPFRPAAGTAAPVEDEVIATPTKTIAGQGVNAFRVTLGSHAGTHVDAPYHLDDDGLRIDQLPLDSFAGTGVVLDMRRGIDQPILVEDMLRADPAIAAGDIVLLETGWASEVGKPHYRRHHPYVSVEAARWLVDRGIKAVGIDASSVEAPKSMRGPDFRHDTLSIFLTASVPVIHGLVALDRVRGRRCRIAAFPIIFEGMDAGPARVVAMLDDTSEETT